MSQPVYTPVTVVNQDGAPAYRCLVNLSVAKDISPSNLGGAFIVFENGGYRVKETVEQLRGILKRAGVLYEPLSKDGQPSEPPPEWCGVRP